MTKNKVLQIMSNMKIQKTEGYEEVAEAMLIVIDGYKHWYSFLEYMDSEGKDETDIGKLKINLWHILTEEREQ